jgi:hypothetical protein
MQERKREERGKIWRYFLILVLEEGYVLIEMEKLASLLYFLQEFRNFFRRG